MIFSFWFNISNCSKTKVLDLFLRHFLDNEVVHKDRAGSHMTSSIMVKTDWNDVLLGTGTVSTNFSNLVFHQIRALLLLFKA